MIKCATSNYLCATICTCAIEQPLSYFCTEEKLHFYQRLSHTIITFVNFLVEDTKNPLTTNLSMTHINHVAFNIISAAVYLFGAYWWRGLKVSIRIHGWTVQSSSVSIYCMLEQGTLSALFSSTRQTNEYPIVRDVCKVFNVRRKSEKFDLLFCNCFIYFIFRSVANYLFY